MPSPLAGDEGDDPQALALPSAPAGRALHSVSTGPTSAELSERIAALEGMLTTRPAIEQAKGALMITCGSTADDAFAVLRRYSQNGNIKIRDIAEELTRNAPHRPLSAATSTRAEPLTRHHHRETSKPPVTRPSPGRLHPT
jgi:hypothetical protein